MGSFLNNPNMILYFVFQQKSSELVGRNRHLALLWWLVLLGSFVELQAQIVNIEDKRRQLDTIGWAGQLDLSGQLTQNTRKVLALSAALRLDGQMEKHNYLLLGNYNLALVDDDRFLNDGFGHLRFGRTLTQRWTLEAFGQLQYNRRLRIGLRGLLGAGPRIQLFSGDKGEVTTALLYMFEYNELNEGDIYRRDHRLSAYLSMRWQPAPQLSFHTTTYYQPLLTAWADRRFSTINTLVLAVSEHLRLTSSFSLVFDGLLARLAENVPSTTYQWKNGLRIQF
jgi:hypothetical protein